MLFNCVSSQTARFFKLFALNGGDKFEMLVTP